MYTPLVLDKNSSRQFSILINDNDLRKIDLYGTLKRTALIEQKAAVRETPCYIFNYTRDVIRKKGKSRFDNCMFANLKL